jgi:hypothetical protein
LTLDLIERTTTPFLAIVIGRGLEPMDLQIRLGSLMNWILVVKFKKKTPSFYVIEFPKTIVVTDLIHPIVN